MLTSIQRNVKLIKWTDTDYSGKTGKEPGPGTIIGHPLRNKDYFSKIYSRR